MQNQLPTDMLRISIDTRGPVPGELLLRMADGVLADLRLMDGIEPDTIIEIHHLGRGSTVLELIFGGMVAVGTIGLFALQLADHFRNGSGHAAETVVQITNYYQATTLVVIAADIEPIEIPREAMPTPTDRNTWTSRSPLERPDYLTTESGEIITDDDGTPLEVSPRSIRADKTPRHGGDPYGTDSAAPPDFDDDDNSLWGGSIEMLGQFISAFNGRIRLFRSSGSEYQVNGPEAFMAKIPNNVDLIVRADYPRGGEDMRDVVMRAWRAPDSSVWHSPTDDADLVAPEASARGNAPEILARNNGPGDFDEVAEQERIARIIPPENADARRVLLTGHFRRLPGGEIEFEDDGSLTAIAAVLEDGTKPPYDERVMVRGRKPADNYNVLYVETWETIDEIPV